MKLEKLKRTSGFVMAVVFSIFLALMLRVGIEGVMAPVKLSSMSNSASSEGASESRQSASSIANNLLTDSILTIVQNYYVDNNRVESQQLLDSGLYFLTEDQEYSLISKDSGYVLEKDGHSIALDIRKPFDYDQLLQHSFKISKFISKVEGIEKSSQDNYWQDKGTFKFLNTVLHSLDPHSSLLNASDYEELKQGTEGTFGGLGVVVSFENSMLRVVKAIENSPAEKAGIKAGNLIVSINRKNTFGLSLNEVIELMRGESGTNVELDILEKNARSARHVSIQRKVVKVNSVEEELLRVGEKKFLKLYIESFSASTAEEVDNLIQNNPDIDGVILDLRSNPGGLLDQAVKLSDLFLEKGDIVSTKGRYEEVERARYSERDFAYPVIVLVNGDTASASEIVAGSLQDNNRAIVIGQPSFGKGSVQTVFELPGGQALKLTVARYYTPNGTSIQNIGVYPDIWMQGVYKDSSNLNLLGENRFLEERFLANSLQVRSTSARRSKYKFYYMDTDKDDVLEFSKKLLLKINNQFGSTVTDSYMRSSLWLARNHEFLVKSGTRSERRVSRYLKNDHNLSWKNESKHISTKLSLKMTPLNERFYTEGENLRIYWELRNSSDTDVERVTIVLKEGRQWGSSFEKVVGTIPSNSVVTGYIEAPIPDVDSNTEIPYLLSYAESSVYSQSNIKKFNIEVDELDQPNLSYKVSLLDKNGKKVTYVKPGARSIIEIDIQNNSEVDISDLKYKIFNLTGNQISLEDKNQYGMQDTLLKSHDHLTLRLAIESSDELNTDLLKFGLQLQALNRIYSKSNVIELSTTKPGGDYD